MTSNSDLDAFREQMLRDIEAKKKRREQKKPVVNTQLARRPAGALTAAQEVFGTAELRQNILLFRDPLTLLRDMATDPATHADVYASGDLRRRLYLQQLPEVPLSARDPWRKHQVNIWEPNRILLPTNDSEFVFRVHWLDNIVLTLRMGTQRHVMRTEIHNDWWNPIPDPDPLFEDYPVLELTVGPLHPVPLWGRTIPKRVVNDIFQAVTTDAPIPRGIRETMLVDRATDVAAVISSEFTDDRGWRVGRERQIVLIPGQTLGELAREAIPLVDEIREYQRKHE